MLAESPLQGSLVLSPNSLTNSLHQHVSPPLLWSLTEDPEGNEGQAATSLGTAAFLGTKEHGLFTFHTFLITCAPAEQLVDLTRPCVTFPAFVRELFPRSRPSMFSLFVNFLGNQGTSWDYKHRIKYSFSLAYSRHDLKFLVSFYICKPGLFFASADLPTAMLARNTAHQSYNAYKLGTWNEHKTCQLNRKFTLFCIFSRLLSHII